MLVHFWPDERTRRRDRMRERERERIHVFIIRDFYFWLANCTAPINNMMNNAIFPRLPSRAAASKWKTHSLKL